MSQEKPDHTLREEGRPDPETLLKRYNLRDIQEDEDENSTIAPGKNDHRRRHGRLRVYLASVAGSGKTYAMLTEGHRREARGTDIVIGVVVTHGRPQTQAMVGDLEVMPLKKITYRGVTLEEMDTDAIIARHPQIWPANDRVLVGFDARPHTRQVIRDAWRLAHSLHAELIAVSIQPEGYLAFTSKLIRFLKFRSDASRQYELAQQRIEDHARLAEDLGAEVVRVSSRDIAKTLVQVAKKYQVTQIVLGQPAHSWWEEILRLSTAMDIHLVPRESEE